jgi:hypothetical protein
MVSGEMGRLQVPDWTADDPSGSFVRGFGKMATRNSKGFGLFGERAFSDFNNAVRFKESLTFRQEGWPATMPVDLRFRRLYFDGKLAGRFEYGFIVDHDVEERIGRIVSSFSYDVALLASAVQDIPIVVHSMDGGQKLATVGTCAEALGLAYIMATTKQSDLSSFPPADTYGKFVAVGNALIHMRVSGGKAVKLSRDRFYIEGSDNNLFITSAEKSSIRNNVIVQLSNDDVMKEGTKERAIRVIFSHMNALLYAESHFVKVNKALKLGTRSALASAVKDMLARFERVGLSGPKAENDIEVDAAIKVFAKAYAGRPDELIEKLEVLAMELAKPSTGATVIGGVVNYVKGLIELVVTTGVKAAVQGAIKSS